jgi:hypothetical protein
MQTPFNLDMDETHTSTRRAEPLESQQRCVGRPAEKGEEAYVGARVGGGARQCGNARRPAPQGEKDAVLEAEPLIDGGDDFAVALLVICFNFKGKSGATYVLPVVLPFY